MKKKTVALIIPTLCNGGAEKIAADMSIFLSEAGFRVVFFLEQFDKNDCYRHIGKEVVIKADSAWDNSKLIKQMFHCYRRAVQYRCYKKQYHVDISISFMVQENLTNILSDIGDKKILTLHSVTSQIKSYNGQLFARPFILKVIYPKADEIIAASRYVRQDLEQNYGLKRGIVEVIYNSVDISSLKILAKEPFEREECENLILYIGRLDDEKRPWIAVRVMKHIVKKLENATLLLLGTGENKRQLKRLIKIWNLEDHVKLCGFQENVAKFMIRAKVLMICSESEAFSCTLAESLALGLPAVAVDCPGGIREVLSSKREIWKKNCSENMVVDCGIITPMINMNKDDMWQKELNREESEFAEGICTILNNPELRLQLSRNAINRARTFAQSRVKEQWLKLIH